MSDATQFINPFVGLRAFEENEDYLFFGRGVQINDLLKKFKDNRFLAVIGSSGSGKSSLVKSGLLPAIYSGFMTVGSNWRVALMQPGENPIGYLTKQLAEEGTLYTDINTREIPYESVIESRLRRSEKGLLHVYEDAHLPPNENLLIVVDQFEELFRFSKYEKENKLGKSDAMHFIQILLTAVQQKQYPIYVLLTMRSDFLGDCAEFRGLPEAINKGQYLVPRMTRDEIREAITGPVAVSNATITQRLVTRLLNDINNDTDQLPVLQHAMMRTWDAWHKRNQLNTPIDFEDYEKIGTMKEALSIHADEAFKELRFEKEQHICELMFKALTDKSADLRGIRRPRSIDDLCLLTGGTAEQISQQVEIFRKPGRTFLMPPPYIPLTNNSIVDISHESLMRVWDRLVKWADDEARSGDIYLRLAASAVLNKKGERGLLKDPELQLALRWKEKNRPTPKWSEGFKANYQETMDYLEASSQEDILEKKEDADVAAKKILEDKQAARRKLKNVIFALMTLLLLAASFSTCYFRHLKTQAEIERANAEDQAREAKRQKIFAVQARLEADSLRHIAENNADSAHVQRKLAEQSAGDATKARIEADHQKEMAKDSAAEAQRQRDIAKDSAAEAQRQRRIVSDQNLKNAPSEYARRIREGPFNRKEIKKDTFDYKLLAYADHLEILGPLIENTGDKDAILKYKNLHDKLYYNNDLYEKIYACLVNTTDPNAKKAVFSKVENYKGSFPDELDSGDTDLRQAKSLTGKKIAKLVKDKKDQLVICSTDDNWLYVFNTAKNSFVLESRIPMGARVTALDYNSENDIIYFGIESGDIGYLVYDKDKKNQPVFENVLGSPVTAIRLFKYSSSGEQRTFLLAAAKKGKVVVYTLDNNNPKPDDKLLGNTLPEKNLIDVINAKFDEQSKQVIIKVRSTKNGTETIYSWNPFAKEALEKYRKNKTDPDYETKYLNPTNIYNLKK